VKQTESSRWMRGAWEAYFEYLLKPCTEIRLWITFHRRTVGCNVLHPLSCKSIDWYLQRQEAWVSCKL